MKDELDALFSAHDERKRTAEQAKLDQAQQLRNFQTLAANLLASNVMPALRALSADLVQRGHESSCGASESMVLPSATLNFRPADVRNCTQSVLRFQTRDNETIHVSWEVWSRKGKSGGDPLTPKGVPFETVDAEWVKQQTLAFIKAVLEKNSP